MASYPGPKVHRVNRRKLGRGQSVQVPPLTFTMTDATTFATMHFSQPVVITGTPPLVISGSVTVTSFTMSNPLTCVIACSGSLTGLTWSIAANVPQIRGQQGQGVAANSGTFT